MLTQIIQHPALNAVRDGVIKALADKGFVANKTIILDEENAQGNIGLATLIAQKFVGKNPDVIIAISTPSAQTAVTVARGEIPIVFAAVTDPVAADIIDAADTAHASVTGVLDRAPFENQIKLIKRLMGHKNRLGFIYNVNEINSVVALNIFKEYASELGLDLIPASASNSSDVGMIVQGIIDKVDALYIPNDNTVVSAIESIIKISSDTRKPVFAADIMLVENGVMATEGVSYEHIGYLAGDMAAKILQGVSVNTIPIVTPHEHLLYINKTQAGKIGFDIPADVLARADETF